MPNTSKMVLKRIKQANVKLLEWPFQSIALTPVENLWTMFKKPNLCLETNQFKRNNSAKRSGKIFSKKHVDGYEKHLIGEQFAKGCLIKY